MRAAARHRGDNFTTNANDPKFEQLAHTLRSARAGLDFRSGRYGVAVWGENLTDEDYILGGLELFGTDLVSLNPPRIWGVELLARF